MRHGDLQALTRKVGFEIVQSERFSSISGSWRQHLKRGTYHYELVSDREDGCFGLWLRKGARPRLLFGVSQSNLSDTSELLILETWLAQLK